MGEDGIMGAMSSLAGGRRQPSAAVMAAAEPAATAANAAQHAGAPPPQGSEGGMFGDALFGAAGDEPGGAEPAAAAAAAAASPKPKDRRDLTDAERRDRRLQQNRLAAKRSYNKRVQRQQEMEQEYEKLRAAGDSHLHYVSGAALLGQVDGDLESPLVGGVHPSDLGEERLRAFWVKALPGLLGGVRRENECSGGGCE